MQLAQNEYKVIKNEAIAVFGESEVFIDNFKSIQLIADRLVFSENKLSEIVPISATILDQLGDNERETVDAFIKRFEQVQDIIENKLFRGIALLEQEDISDK